MTEQLPTIDMQAGPAIVHRDLPADVYVTRFAPSVIRLTIIGQPCSKANSRRIVMISGRPQVIKSSEALAYERDALRQIPPACRRRLEGPVRVTLRLFYASERPDLDESLVLDVLQDRPDRAAKVAPGAVRPLLQAGVYRNDRQVREKHVYHAVDKANPRAEIEVEPVLPQAGQLDLAAPLRSDDDDDPFA